MNPAITTGTSPYMGGSRTRGHHHRFYHSNLYGSGQVTLHHGHSGPVGIDTSFKAWKTRCYHHGHSGPEEIVEETRRSGLTRHEELKLKHDGRRGET